MNHRKGFIALTSVLILSVLFLSVSISIALRAIAVSGVGIAFYERDQAHYVSEACAEYVFMELQRTISYHGNEDVTIGETHCTVHPIINESTYGRTVRVESTVGSVTYRLLVAIDSISPEFVIHSMKRVVSF